MNYLLGGVHKMGAIKNVIFGILKGIRYGCMNILLPFLTFTFIRQINVAGLDIYLSNTKFQEIMFWVTALSLLVISAGFATSCSPKHSKRRAIFGIMLTISNCLYLYSYKYTGATLFELEIVDLGRVSVDLTLMLNLSLGVVFLNIIMNIYEFFDAIAYQKKYNKALLSRDKKNELNEPSYQEYLRKNDKEGEI